MQFKVISFIISVAGEDWAYDNFTATSAYTLNTFNANFEPPTIQLSWPT